MSTVTVVKKNNQIAIAADSMTKWGRSKESAEYVINHNKILQLGETYLAIIGPTSAKTILKNYFSRREVKARFDTVESIFDSWIKLHESVKTDYFLCPHEDPEDSFESTRMDVLIANMHGIFGVSAHRAVQEFSKFYAYGTGGEYALGAMYSSYDNEGSTAEDIARLGVKAAAEFDDSTGLPIISYSLANRASIKKTKQSRRKVSG